MTGNGNATTLPAHPGFRGSGSWGSPLHVPCGKAADSFPVYGVGERARGTNFLLYLTWEHVSLNRTMKTETLSSIFSTFFYAIVVPFIGKVTVPAALSLFTLLVLVSEWQPA